MAKYQNLGISGMSDENKPVSTDTFAQAQDRANAANEQRYQQGLSMWERIVGAYAPNGSFGQGAMASYQQGMDKAKASYAQNMVSSGLYDPTTMAGFSPRYEQEVGNPFRLNLADEQTRGYTQGLQGAAGFVERRNDVGPDPNMVAGLNRAAANRPQQQEYDFGTSAKPRYATPTDSGYYQGSEAGKPQSSWDEFYGTGGTARPGIDYGGTGMDVTAPDWMSPDSYTPAQQDILMQYNEPSSQNYLGGWANASSQPDYGSTIGMSDDEFNNWMNDYYNFGD